MILTNRSIDIEKVNRIAEVLKTIGHPVRLQVLELLEQEEPSDRHILHIFDCMDSCKLF